MGGLTALVAAVVAVGASLAGLVVVAGVGVRTWTVLGMVEGRENLLELVVSAVDVEGLICC